MSLPQELKTLLSVAGLCCICAVAAPRPSWGQEAPDEVKVFTLVNADSAESATLLSQLFDAPAVRVAADRRTNSVVCQGPAANLAVIEALLLKLDSIKNHASKNRKVQPAKKLVPAKPITPIPDTPLRKIAPAKFRVQSPRTGVLSLHVTGGRPVKKGAHLATVKGDGEAKLEKRAREQKDAVAAAALAASAIAVEMAQAEYAVAKHLLDHDKAAANLEQIEWKTELSRVASEIRAKEQLLQSEKERFGTGTVTAAELVHIETELEQAKLQSLFLQEKLAFQVKHATPLAIAQAEAQLLTAKLAVERAKRDYERRAQANRGDRKPPQDSATWKVIAPQDGVVEYEPGIREGVRVRPRQTILTLRPTSQK